MMNQKDRTELRRILKARFELLQQQLKLRQQQVQDEINKAIRQESEEAIKTAQHKAEKLKEKAEKLQAEGAELEAEMLTQGIRPGKDGRYGYKKLVSVDVAQEWQPINLDHRVEQAYRQVIQEAGLHKLDLGMQQLELEEELAIGALDSTEAKDFLAKIPSVDTLLPTGTAQKAIVTVPVGDPNDERDEEDV